MKIVEIWPRGYAHQDGLQRLTIADEVDPKSAAAIAFGPAAKVYAVRPAITPPVAPVSDAQARAMSQFDNS